MLCMYCVGLLCVMCNDCVCVLFMMTMCVVVHVWFGLCSLGVLCWLLLSWCVLMQMSGVNIVGEFYDSVVQYGVCLMLIWWLLVLLVWCASVVCDVVSVFVLTLCCVLVYVVVMLC